MESSIYNNDCFNIFDKIENKVIDLVLVDLPYGQTHCDWDICIDLKEMWKSLKIICKDKCQFVFFTTTRFGYKLIESNPKWFRYDLVWEKSIAVGFLNANKMPLRSHEMIYIFSNPNTDDIELVRNIEMREYAKKVLKYINKPVKQIERELGHRKACHFLSSYTSTQFKLPTEKTYIELIDKYNIDKMEGYLTFENLIFEKKETKIYNPQKTPGKPYKVKEHNSIDIDVYGGKKVPAHENTTGDRHPKSVLKYHQSSKKLHPTQKPLELCEWLIKTYSNDGDLVLDFCMGSGTTIQAAINTNRKYIGIEKDKEIFETAEKRIK
jgi:site-specific DNA-methyltransferase (adenine-specific)